MTRPTRHNTRWGSVLFWLVLKPRRKYGPFTRITATTFRCRSGSFHSGVSGARAGVCVGARMHARVSSCVPDAAPIDIGCVSSVEALLVYTRIHTRIDFRWP